MGVMSVKCYVLAALGALIWQTALVYRYQWRSHIGVSAVGIIEEWLLNVELALYIVSLGSLQLSFIIDP